MFEVGGVHDKVTEPVASATTWMLNAGKLALAVPSLTLILMLLNVPTLAAVGVPLSRPVLELNAAQAGALAMLNVSVLPSASVALATGSVTLSWLPPTQNTDGSPLADLAGYRVYWGPAPGNYPNSVTVPNAGLATYVVGQLTPAVWHFAVTAYTNAGIESAYSNVASKTVQ